MPRKMSLPTIIILVLVVVGLVSQTISNPYQLLIPVFVFGAIYLLYKFPPGAKAKSPKPPQRYKTGARRDQQASRTKTRKNMPFRVIEGGKDDDDLPKYH
ncbi:hypothetical protein I8J29_07190 [Paenibacillus sp. MWE-103]|uniref:DUF3951 domain-containing protein n=1 Tax=Paenibacillus artemisiicola TaxID=1172618 RepID=A0ABS3W6N8_9BACL|nr:MULTISPECIES: hypothetical protein [Paenibacillus]MBO7743970.1 hypothetical protein [Paenibacillus artemisiicola]SFI58310.1 hypothetical protein SAMN02799624_01489 [Paenibacillus sp. UNC496MF]